MSNEISKAWTYESGYLPRDQKMRVAIDIMPILYKYLYVGDMKSPQGPLKSGSIITSYIYNIVRYLIKVKTLNVDIYLCLDHPDRATNDLKNEVVNGRMEARKKIVDSYEKKIQNNDMAPYDWFRYNCAKYYITVENMKFLETFFLELGFKVFRIKGVEAESLCTYLKKQGLVDYCYSIDKDITLYGVDALIHLNPDTGAYLLYNHASTLSSTGLTEDQFLNCVIAAGTDYSKGIVKVGAVTALKLVKEDSVKFAATLDLAVGPATVIKLKRLFRNELPETDKELVHYLVSKYLELEPRLCASSITEILTGLEFSPSTIRTFIKDLESDINSAPGFY